MFEKTLQQGSTFRINFEYTFIEYMDLLNDNKQTEKEDSVFTVNWVKLIGRSIPSFPHCKQVRGNSNPSYGSAVSTNEVTTFKELRISSGTQ